MNCQLPAVSTANSPAQRTPLRCASTACQLGLEPSSPARGLVLHDRTELLVSVAEDVGGNGDAVAYGALDCVPPTIEHGCRFCDPDPARRFAALRCGHLAVEYPTSRPHEPLSYLRGAIAPDLAAIRPARPGRLRLGRLARRGRPDVVADAPARPARRAPLAVQVGVGVRRLAEAAGRAGRPRQPGGGARLPRAGRRTGSRTGSRSPARTRSPTRCASTASGARCAPTRPSAA